MYIALDRFRIKTEASFTAEDPWNQNRQAPFTVEDYVYVAKGTKVRPDVKPSGDYIRSIRSNVDGVERILPDSLSELWRVNGPFGGYQVTGSYSGPAGSVATTSNIIVNGVNASGWVYDFTGPLNGPGYVVPSQLPVTPCVIAGGCPPPVPLTAGLHVAPNESNNTIGLQFTDAGEPFDGTGP